MFNDFQDAISSFSEKLKRFSASQQKELKIQPTEDQILQKKIIEHGERLKFNVISTYKIYKSPYEALGKMSERAASIDNDEQLLLQAYNLYKEAMELNKNSIQSLPQAENCAHSYISKVELSCPLCTKASYTSGGQFIYLLCWLYFEKGCQEYFPFFIEHEKSFELSFCPAANFSFLSHDKELFEIVKREFYS